MKNSAFFTGFLASLASIVTGLSSSYKFDVLAESYRAAAVEYRLLSTRITAILRREENDNEKWDSLWEEIEVRTSWHRKESARIRERAQPTEPLAHTRPHPPPLSPRNARPTCKRRYKTTRRTR